MFSLIKQKYITLTSDTKFSEILTGSAWALSARLLATALGLIFSVIVARFYGAEILGVLAVVNSFLMLTTIFTVFGTDTSILRLIPEHLAKYSPTSAFKVYRKTKYMVIGISIATSALFFFGADLIAEEIFSKTHLSYYFSLASLFIIFQSLINLNTQAIRGLRLIRVFALMLLLPQSLNLVFLTVIAKFWPIKDAPIYAVLTSIVVISTVGWIIGEYAFKKRIHYNDSVHALSGRTILTISLPMLMATTMAFIIGQTGVIMLSMFRSEAEVGYYAIAVKIATLTAFVLNAVNSMAGPKFSELYHSDKLDELFYVAKKSTKLIFWITTPILFMFIILGKPILYIAFGHEFVVAYSALVLLSLGQFVNSISGSTGLFMDMTGNQNIYKNIMFASAVINISLNLFLIPKFGINGAAFSGMASLIFLNITTLHYIKSNFGKTTGYLPWISILRDKLPFSKQRYK